MRNNLAFKEIQNGFQHTIELNDVFILSKKKKPVSWKV